MRMPREFSKLTKMARAASHRPYSPPSSSQSHKGRNFVPFLSLKASMANAVLKDENLVVIEDKYPKAKHHFLILPKEPDGENARINDVTCLTPKHIGLLENMLKMADKITTRDVPDGVFQIGFHSVPSMTPLHMHVISIDFDSPCLKNKKHWNTFTSEFFLPALSVIEQLEKAGKVTVDRQRCEELIKRDLWCRWCSKPLKNIPELKAHLRTSVHKLNLTK